MDNRKLKIFLLYGVGTAVISDFFSSIDGCHIIKELEFLANMVKLKIKKI